MQIFKGTVHPQMKNTKCSSCLWCRLSISIVWCELQSFEDITCRDVCLLLDIIELDGTQLVVLKETSLLSFCQMYFLGGLERHKPSTMDNIREKADISPADISKLTPK